MKTIKLNTNLIGLDGIFCTYWGLGNTEFTLQEDGIQDDFNEGYTDVHPDYYYGNFDNSAYMKAWDEKIQKYLEGELTNLFDRELDTKITYKALGYWSPREYNFSHDCNDFELTGDFSSLISYCLGHEDFAQYLKDHYTSYDGFTSFTANNVSDWQEDIQNEDNRAYGAAISFLIDKELSEEIENEKYEVLYEMSYSEYVNYKLLEDFQEDLKKGEIDFESLEVWQKALIERDACSTDQLRNLINDCYRESKTIEQTVKVIQDATEVEYDFTNMVKHQFEGIGNQSLTMF